MKALRSASKPVSAQSCSTVHTIRSKKTLKKTKELVATCNKLGLSLEAEVGAIGGEEDGVIGMGECADPKECKMVADLGVTMLAAGIGNIHGKYPANWKGLSFETLDAIQQLTGEMPLVLHGGTGIPCRHDQEGYLTRRFKDQC